MSSFFVVELKVYRLETEEVWRIFRPNIPAVSYRETTYHTKVLCKNPETIIQSRPDMIETSGMWISTRGGSWVFSEYGIWIFRGFPVSEEQAKGWKALTTQWQKGSYQGEQKEPYRNEM